jgi:hypothetical protein
MRRSLTSLPVIVCFVAVGCGGRSILLDDSNRGDADASVDDAAIADGGERLPDGRTLPPRDGGVLEAGRDGCAIDGSTLRDGGAIDGPSGKDGGAEDGSSGKDGSTKDGSSTDDGGIDCGSLTDCDGACVDLSSDPNDCKTCDAVCSAPASGSATCTSGVCGFSCNIGYEVCGAACCTCGDTSTDPNNCGTCGHSCGGQGCVMGVCTPTTIATMLDNAYALALDNTNVYWTEQGTGTNGLVVQEVVGGGTPITLASSQIYPAGIAVTSSRVYWSANAEILSVPIGGGSITTIANDPNEPYALAVDAKNVYWTDYGFGPPSGYVMSAPLGGGSMTTLASK